MCGVMACMDIAAGRSTKHASQGCPAHHEHVSVICVRLVAVMEQSSAPRALDLDEVTAATEEHA
eukprot:COSAG06_NODE_23999_length_675_cov_1.559028_1_plen_63_part_10